MKDEDIVREIAVGDYSHFDELYNRHRAKFFSVANRIVRDRSVAEEIVQESFLKLSFKAGTFRGDSKFTCWFFRVISNQAFQYLRKKKRTDEYSNRYTQIPKEFFEQVWTQEQREWLAKSVRKHQAKLPGILSTIFEAIYFDELTIKEVAEQTGLEVGAIKTRYYRARTFVRDSIIRDLRRENALPMSKLLSNSR